MAGRSPAGTIFPETQIREVAVRSAGSDRGGAWRSGKLQERSVCLGAPGRSRSEKGSRRDRMKLTESRSEDRADIYHETTPDRGIRSKKYDQ